MTNKYGDWRILFFLISLAMIVGAIIGIYYLGTSLEQPHCNRMIANELGGSSMLICSWIEVLEEKINSFICGLVVTLGLLVIIAIVMGLIYAALKMADFFMRIIT